MVTVFGGLYSRHFKEWFFSFSFLVKYPGQKKKKKKFAGPIAQEPHITQCTLPDFPSSPSSPSSRYYTTTLYPYIPWLSQRTSTTPLNTLSTIEHSGALLPFPKYSHVPPAPHPHS